VGARVTAKPIGNPVILTTEEAAGLFPCLTIAFSGSVGVIAVRGDHAALRGRKLALFSSVKCPGDIILKTFDLAQHLRDQGVTVIGGFHSPMEQECLRILLRGKQPVVWCPARSIERMVIWHGLSRFDAGRLRQTGRQIEELARKAWTWKKPLYTFASPYNEALVKMGAVAVEPGNLSWFKESTETK